MAGDADSQTMVFITNRTKWQENERKDDALNFSAAELGWGMIPMQSVPLTSAAVKSSCVLFSALHGLIVATPTPFS
jgi:hypothetical protein